MLTAKQRSLIRDMCAIAGAQGRDLAGRGEGDYQTWTHRDFVIVDELMAQMLQPDPGLELLRSLRSAHVIIRLVYDASEDRPINPVMQTIGRVMVRVGRVLAKYQGGK